MKRTTEGRYEHSSRIAAGISAIEHLVLPLPEHHDVRRAFYGLHDHASDYLAMARERNMIENGWVYGEEEPRANIHPDHQDPDLRRAVVVCIAGREEADVDLYTVGPFPMEVGESEDGQKVIVESEEDLMAYIAANYESFTTTRPMPWAPHRPGCRSNWRELREPDI